MKGMLPDLVRVLPVLGAKDLFPVLQHVQNQPFLRSSVLDINGDDVGRSRARTSSSMLLDEQHEVAMLLHERLNQAVLAYAQQLRELHPSYDCWPVPGSAGVHSWREPLQALRYLPGERYLYHQDCHFDGQAVASQRILSIVLYLNSDFEGGETEFAGFRVKPGPGEAVVFPSNWCFPHAGCEVSAGTKYAIVTWFHAYPLR